MKKTFKVIFYLENRSEMKKLKVGLIILLNCSSQYFYMQSVYLQLGCLSAI